MITVYGSPSCGKCFVAKQKLDKAGIEYEYVGIEEMSGEELDELIMKYGMELPIILKGWEQLYLEDLI